MISSLLAPILRNLLWTEGQILLLIGICGLILGYYTHPFIWYLSLGFLLFSFYFFRNPERDCPQAHMDHTLIVSPSDGKVVDVKKGDFEGYAQRVSIFLSPFDVHVNWTPVAGIIERVTYRSGTFAFAFTDKSSELNERNDIVIVRSDGSKVLVRQIAGTIARKIVCWIGRGTAVGVCEKYGMIRFGSRVDLLFPEHVTVDVTVGQRVYGGQTIIGRWS